MTSPAPGRAQDMSIHSAEQERPTSGAAAGPGAGKDSGAPVGAGGRATAGSGADTPGAVRLYDPGEAARLLCMRESTLREWARRRKVPHRRLGRAIRFSDADLKAIVSGSLVAPLAGTTGVVPVTVVPVPLPKRRRGPSG